MKITPSTFTEQDIIAYANTHITLTELGKQEQIEELTRQILFTPIKPEFKDEVVKHIVEIDGMKISYTVLIPLSFIIVEHVYLPEDKRGNGLFTTALDLIEDHHNVRAVIYETSPNWFRNNPNKFLFPQITEFEGLLFFMHGTPKKTNMDELLTHLLMEGYTVPPRGVLYNYWEANFKK